MANTSILLRTNLVENTTEKFLFLADFGLSNKSYGGQDEYFSVLDIAGVKVAIITCYIIVFISCFFGNLLIILVVFRHPNMKSVTNFLLTNLAVADLCVGIFCVLPRMSLYINPRWIFGLAMCKLHNFIEGVSYATSIGTLTLIALERYCIIIYPLKMKRFITKKRLKIAIVVIWICALLWSIPDLLIFSTVQDTEGNTYCLFFTDYDIKAYVMVDFALLFVTPLCIMGFLYTRICFNLWWTCRQHRRLSCHSYTRRSLSHSASTQSRERHDRESHSSKLNSPIEEFEAREVVDCSALWNDPDRNVIGTMSQAIGLGAAVISPPKRRHSFLEYIQRTFSKQKCITREVALIVRRRVIRLLLVMVITFALCITPYHIRVIWQFYGFPHWSSSPEFIPLFSQISFILFFLNSGLNPFLYAFLSKNFRHCAADVITCRLRQENMVFE